MELHGTSILILDIETQNSAQDCRYCGRYVTQDTSQEPCPQHHDGAEDITPCKPIGWKEFASLGLSIGCYYDYVDGLPHFFDRHCLLELLARVSQVPTLLVSFNGVSFDFPLLYALILSQADTAIIQERPDDATSIMQLLQRFDNTVSVGYDILQQIWAVQPQGQYESGLNSLDALSQANGFGAKLLSGALAPHLWKQGHYADVINYNLDDVMKTKALFERIVTEGGLWRKTGWLELSPPRLPVWGT